MNPTSKDGQPTAPVRAFLAMHPGHKIEDWHKLSSEARATWARVARAARARPAKPKTPPIIRYRVSCRKIETVTLVSEKRFKWNYVEIKGADGAAFKVRASSLHTTPFKAALAERVEAREQFRRAQARVITALGWHKWAAALVRSAPRKKGTKL